jgi:Protein of unknown function (DUF2795)
MPHASKRDYETAFDGLDFPASKAAVVNRARDNGGIDAEVFDIVARLPDGPFESLDSLLQAVRETYLSDGVEPDSLPV